MIRLSISKRSLASFRKELDRLKNELREAFLEALLVAGQVAIGRIKTEFFVPMPLENAVGKKLDLSHGRDLGGYKSPSLVASLQHRTVPTKSGAKMFYGSVSPSEKTVGKAKLFEGFGQDERWQPFSEKTLRAGPGKWFVVPVNPVVVEGRTVRMPSQMVDAGWFIFRRKRAYLGIPPEGGDPQLLYIGPLKSIQMPSRPFLTMQLASVVNDTLSEVAKKVRPLGLLDMDGQVYHLKALIKEAQQTPE